MCLSPDGNKLVTVHQSGLLSMWDVPSFKRRGAWPIADQVKYSKSHMSCGFIEICDCLSFNVPV